MRILHLLSQRPDSTGSGIYIQAMLREAADAGHENFLVAGLQSDQDVHLDCIDDRQCTFVKFHRADISYPIVGMSDVMPYDSTKFCNLSEGDLREYERAFARHFTKAVDRFQPDIIHSHHLWIMTSLARRLFPRIPMVTTCHGSDLRQFQNCSHLRQGVLQGCRRIDAVMALSRAQKEEIVQRYGIPAPTVHVVGAGYNDALFSLGEKPDPCPVQLVYAGKLSNAKGVPWFLTALETISSPEWHLHLVGGGSGAEKARCLESAGALGDRVTIHGTVTQDVLAELMKQGHIFVLPSFFEGLPLVVLEALACGCRIIATDLPGVRELLGDMRSDFIELVQTPRLHSVDTPYPEDLESFEQALAQALNTQITLAGRCPHIDPSMVRAKLAAYTWSGIFKKVEGVYAQVLPHSNV
jgi:glycosyltransferase involved in cell wall biosynthesis